VEPNFQRDLVFRVYLESMMSQCCDDMSLLVFVSLLNTQKYFTAFFVLMIQGVGGFDNIGGFGKSNDSKDQEL